MSNPNPKKDVSSVNADLSMTSDEDVANGNVVDITAGSQALHRSLRGKEVNLFAIGGAIGTCEQPLSDYQ